jgi:CelD/BcsL family acetyltransferase involved in cellulose biosynthesis
MGSLASKTRYKLNAKRKKLEEDFPGKVIFKTYKEPDDISRACKDIESVAEKTYHRGLGVGFKDNLENRQRFMLFSKDGLLRIYLIYIDGQPVAYWVATLNNRNEIYLDFTGFDPNLKKYELGTMLFLHMLKDSIEGSVKLLDFGSGEAEYKERFGNSQIQEADYYLFSFSIKVLFINISHVISKTSENMIKKIIGDHKILKLIKSKWRSSVIK